MCGQDESTGRVHENGQNNIRIETNQLPVVCTLLSLIISFQMWQFPDCVIMRRGSAWERLSQGRGSSLNEGTSPHVFEEPHPSKPDTIFVHLIIKACSSISCRFYCMYVFIYLFFTPPHVVPVVSSHLFSGQVESVLHSFFFFVHFDTRQNSLPRRELEWRVLFCSGSSFRNGHQSGDLLC